MLKYSAASASPSRPDQATTGLSRSGKECTPLQAKSTKQPLDKSLHLQLRKRAADADPRAVAEWKKRLSFAPRVTNGLELVRLRIS